MNVVSSEDRVVFVEQCTCAIASGGIRDERGRWSEVWEDGRRNGMTPSVSSIVEGRINSNSTS